MKSTPRYEELLDALYGSSSHPIVRAQYRDDNRLWKNLEDVTSLSVNKKAVDTRYGSFSFLPPVGTASIAMDNKAQKYSPGSGTAFENILTRNRELRFFLGYRLDENAADGEIDIDPTTGAQTLYHTQVISSKIYNNIASSAFPPSLTGFTFNTYGSTVYDGDTYEYEGYWLSNPIDLESAGADFIKSIDFDSDSSQIECWVRAGESLADIAAQGFTFLGLSDSGVNSLLSPIQGKQFYQILFLWRSGHWSTTTTWIQNIKIQYESGVAVFDQGIFLADDPGFDSQNTGYKANFSARDGLKKALETEISLPLMTSVDVVEVIRQACQKADIPYTNTSLANLGKLVTIPSTQPFTNVKAQAVFEECLSYVTQVVAQGWRLNMGDDGILRLGQKPLTAVVADYVLTYGFDILSLSKKYSSNSLLQRATVLSKEASTDALTQLATQNYTSTGTFTLSWGSASIYKNIDVFYHTSDRTTVVEILSTTLTSADIRITREGGTAVNVDVTVSGNVISGTPPYAGESYASVNHVTTALEQGPNGTRQKREGFTYKFTNRFIASDAEAKTGSENMIAEFGNKKFQLTVSIWGNPLFEIDDKIMVFEKYTRTNSIFVLESINHTFNANGASFRTNLTFSDLGFLLQNFIWDRNGVTAGPLDILTDRGYLWDQDRYESVDSSDYENLKPVVFA